MAAAGVRIGDVARLAGVSTATVSRVLNGVPSVQPAIRRSVEMAIAELGYQPNRIARSLRVGGSRTLGLMLPDIRNTQFIDIVRGTQQVAYKHDFLVMLCDADRSIDREKKYSEILVAEKVVGVVAVPRDPTGGSLAPLVDAGIPLVVVDRKPDGLNVDAVLADNLEGARAATRHLLETGNERIAMITGPLELSIARERLEGYREALSASGRSEDPNLVRQGDSTQASGYQEMTELLRLSPRPDAVLLANNVIALGALTAIREHHLCVPADIAVAGFDDLPWAPLLDPPLTMVSQPAYEMGLRAAERLLEPYEEGRGAICLVRLQPKLVVRASTAPRFALDSSAPADRTAPN